MPEPDIAVCEGDPDRYDARHPSGSETPLVVQVSGTSAARDQKKSAIYAQAGVAAYWRVDLEARRLEVRCQPDGSGEYTLTRILRPGDRVEVPGKAVSVDVAELVPLDRRLVNGP